METHCSFNHQVFTLGTKHTIHYPLNLSVEHYFQKNLPTTQMTENRPAEIYGNDCYSIVSAKCKWP